MPEGVCAATIFKLMLMNSSRKLRLLLASISLGYLDSFQSRFRSSLAEENGILSLKIETPGVSLILFSISAFVPL
jgi:hypothetical protein